MGKKATPRWNEFGFPDEAPDFALADGQAADLWELISLDNPDIRNTLRTRLDAIAREHLERREDDKTRPALRDQNAALGEILKFKAGDIIPVELPEMVTVRAASVPVFKGVLGVSNGKNAIRFVESVKRRPDYTHEDLITGNNDNDSDNESSASTELSL